MKGKLALVIGTAFVVGAVVMPVVADAHSYDRPDIHERIQDRFDSIGERIEKRFERFGDVEERTRERVCDRLAYISERFGGVTLPSFCGDDEPEPEPEPDPEPELDFSADPTTIALGATSTLAWEATHVDLCTALNGWSGDQALMGSLEVSPTTTTMYTLSCGGEFGTTTENATVTVTEPEPEPSLDHVVISEVFYDVDGAHGTEADNEWIEIYNGTDSAVDLSGWSIEDAFASDVLPGGTVLESGEYLVVTNATSTEDFWVIPAEAVVVALENALGNGLGNAGDVIFLKDDTSAVIDAVSWGTNTDAFDPSVADVAEGHSIARDPVDTDTDTAADWVDREVPTPGS